MSLWRALQSGNSPVNSIFFVFFICPPNKNEEDTDNRKVCVTVGLSSEVYLLPTTNEICDFWLFLG